MKRIKINRRSGFLRRQSRFLPIVGSGIVLATFLVNDTWRESIKKRSETVKAAQVNFEQSESAREIERKLQSVLWDLQQVHDNHSGIGVARNCLFENALYASRNYRVSQQEFVSYESGYRKFTEALRPVIPPSKQFEAIVQRYNKVREGYDGYDAGISYIRVTEDFKRIRADTGSLSPEEQSEMTKRPAHPCVPSNASEIQAQSDTEGVRRGTNSLDAVAIELRQLENQTLDIAEKELARDERHYKWATWCFYALYGLGWLVGLAGKASVEGDSVLVGE